MCHTKIGKRLENFFSHLGTNIDIEFEKIEKQPEHPRQLEKGWKREQVLARLLIPSTFYTGRKDSYKISTLKHFDVGATKQFSKYFGRTCVPVYDITGEYFVHGTFRINSDKKCIICKNYHEPNRVCYRCPKWIHTDGFSNSLLYNLHNVNGQKTVIMVEGPGDVWRLYEAGYSNAVAIFGNNIKENQIRLLQHIGVESIIEMLDSDKAGLEGKQRLQKMCAHIFNIKSILLDRKDVGAMSIPEIQKIL